ncbi:MAG: AAA family ATPase [Gammaproteobacteria bacterium]|nr:AAA family ATPase [Gammaproteobacteria bacterium]
MYSESQENPFADRVDDHTYHSEAIREKRLNLILHLASYSAVLLIQGEKGSGKTTFLSRLREQAQSNWIVCRINGGPGFDKPMLYHALFRVFTSGIPLEDADHPDESLALLVRELAALRHEHRIPVLMIDDADHLPESALETLEELLVMDGGNEDLLSIILTAEPGFEARLVESSLQTFKNRISHVFDLPAFSEQDTSDYINLRLSAAGLEEGNPFTPSAMHLIHTSSKGMPGRINALAQQILAKEKKSQPRRDAPKTTTAAPLKVEARTIPAKPKRSVNWGRIALGIILVPILGLLFFQGSINRWLEQKPKPQNETVQLPALEKPVEMAAAPPAPMPVERRPAAPAPKPAPAPSVVAAASEPVTTPGKTNVEPSAVESPTPSVARPVKTAAGEQSTVEPPAPTAVAEPEPAALPSPPIETATADTATGEEGVEVPETKGAAAVEDVDAAWLASTPDTHLTLQLLAMSPDGAKRFIARHALGDELHTFERLRNGKTLVVLIYGNYPTRAEAQAASKTLTERIKGLKPWIRQLAAVRKDIQPVIVK